ncbi:MAG: preprotein translocase subunit SecE [Chloroflexi bacterium]|nr:preprotein translocase subunit SecE [Chloroflexota bacterium]
MIRDVRNELRRVEWPTRDELIKLTGAVCALSLIVGAYLGLADFVFQELFRFILSLGSGG